MKEKCSHSVVILNESVFVSILYVPLYIL